MDHGSMPRVSEVFGTSRDLPGSYVERPKHESRIDAALSGDHHLAIWGEPRQGKSALIRHRLRPDTYRSIQCGYGQRRYDIYRMILREAGASVAVERKRRRSRGIGAKVSLFSGDFKSEAETTERTFDIDISNANDVLRVIADSGFDKTIVLEDFHYLGRKAQRDILQDLKVFYEKAALRIVLVGVWAERSRLRGLPADLAGWMDMVYVPRWSDRDLLAVLRRGGEVLGLEIAADVERRLVEHAEQSVGLLQDLAYALCMQAPSATRIDDADLLEHATDAVLENGVARVRWYANSFADPSVVLKAHHLYDTTQPYKGILHALLLATPGDRGEGLTVDALLEAMKRLYPYEAASLERKDLRSALAEVASVDRVLKTSPVIAFDPMEERLHVVDPLVRLYLRRVGGDALTQYLPDEGRDIEVDRRRFDRRVLDRYGRACAVCGIEVPGLIRVVRLDEPDVGDDMSRPDFGLPLCLTHAAAWENDQFSIDPETTHVVYDGAAALNIMRDDLTHLPAQPSTAALRDSWVHSRHSTRIRAG
jgi:hypothetical protein